MLEEFGEQDRLDWDTFYMDMCWNISKKSRDPSTKVGAVIVSMDNNIVSVGYNGFPRGVNNTEERWTTRPDKYDYVVHTERKQPNPAALLEIEMTPKQKQQFNAMRTMLHTPFVELKG